MSVASHTWSVARQRADDMLGVLVAAAVIVLLASGQLTLASVWQGHPVALTGLGLFTLALCRALTREFGGEATGSAAGWRSAAREFELGLLLITGVYVLVSISGGPRSFLYPLVYALVSFLLIVHRNRAVAVAWVLAACSLEWLVVHSVTPVRYAIFGYHVTFIVFFAAGNMLVISGLIRRLRGEHERHVQGEVARMHQDARDFRLTAAELPREGGRVRRAEEETRRSQGAVQAVHDQLRYTLDLVRCAMRSQTCALVWLRDDDQLILKEVATQSDRIRARPELAGAGLLATAMREHGVLSLQGLGGRRIPPYYDEGAAISDLCAVPVLEGDTLRGILCADRSDGEPYEVREGQMLQQAAGQVQRIIEQERVLAAVERGKYEQEQFYAASERLNSALTLDDVYDRCFDAMGAIAPYDLAVLTAYDERSDTHRVRAVRLGASEDTSSSWAVAAAALEGRRLVGSATLVGMAVKNRYHMPAVRQRGLGETVVFDDTVKLDEARSLLVLPLLHGERVLGTVTVASRRDGQYSAQVRDMLRVIGHQVAVSLQNARMYRAMEERATTDGLTGLTNHRAFQDRFEQLHALAERTGQIFAIILIDIDHFKHVNDTYGHPTGDVVLKRVSAVLASRARKVDVVARYGGEEFVLILPDTDGEGAALHANRLREEIAAQTMLSEHGNFHVSMSMGVAEFPADGTQRESLIEKADRALYYCKEHGRNRVVRWCDVKSCR
ncbi:MAG: diguanylate cyclase [Nannocystaceae bacterium]